MPVNVHDYDYEDRNMYWSNTYLWCPELAQPVLVDHFTDEDTVEVRAKHDNYYLELDELDYRYPRVGLHNYGSTVVMLKPFPVRQYKKGINTRNLDRHIMFRREVEFANQYDMFSEYGLLEEVFKPNHYKVDEVINLIKAKARVAGTISEQFAVGCSLDYNSLILMYRDIVIGTVDESGVATVGEHYAPLISKTLENIMEVKYADKISG